MKIHWKSVKPILVSTLIVTVFLLWLRLTPQTDAKIARPTFTSAEEWAAAMNQEGTGEIRYRVDFPDSNPGRHTDPAAPGEVLKTKSEGPLTAEAQYWVAIHCDTFIRMAQNVLDETSGSSETPDFRVAEAQLDALNSIYTYNAMKELAASGAYITFLEGEWPPPTPDGCMQIMTTPYPLQSGKTGHALFWIDTRYRKELNDIYGMLKETRAAARWERIRNWNDRPEPNRRDEIEEYLQLDAKALGDPSANLTSAEFARYWRMQMLLQELNAEVFHGRTLLFERAANNPR
jgi:hypothetical protein